MVRIRIATFALLILITMFTAATEAFDWTFWHNKDDVVAKLPRLQSSPTLPKPRNSSSSSSSSNTSKPFLNLVPAFAKHATAKSTITSTYRNWVGPWTVSPDTACYREAHRKMDTCPRNFQHNKLTNTCWTDCPLAYPVKCGMECIRQSDDCRLEVLSKVSAVAMSVFSTASFGIVGALEKLSTTISWAFRCSNSMMLVMRGIIRYIRTIKAKNPQLSDQKVLLLLYQTSTVVTDLPIAITICTKNAVVPNLRLSQYLLSTAEWILKQAMDHDDQILSSWQTFRTFLNHANLTEATKAMTKGEIVSFETAMKQNSSCGGDLQSLVGRIWSTINEYRKDHPSITDGELRIKMSHSALVLSDVPTVTNNCMEQMIATSSLPIAYQTREMLRKTIGIILNDLFKSGKSDNGTSVETSERLFRIIDTGLCALAATTMDPTRLSLLFSEYTQPICGPTQFMGEIDDGTEAATLGLNTLGEAFKDSTSSWTRKGDGAVIIHFTSTDTKDVTVNLRSGGNKIDQVDVKAGGSVKWQSNITALESKTLYMDRLRPGLLGLPGTGGGSLVLWIPQASEGGHLEIKVKLNAS